MSGGEQKQPKKDTRSNATFLAGYGLPSQKEAKEELNKDEMSKLVESARVFGLERFLTNRKLADLLPDGTSVFGFVRGERKQDKDDEFLNMLARPLLEDVKAYFKLVDCIMTIEYKGERLPKDVLTMIRVMVCKEVDKSHLAWKCPCPQTSCECEAWRGRIKNKVREFFQPKEGQC